MTNEELNDLPTLEKAKHIVNEQNTHLIFEYYNGEYFVYFEIIKIDAFTITMIINKQGKIYISEYELFVDINNEPYFEYINPYNKIYLNEFANN